VDEEVAIVADDSKVNEIVKNTITDLVVYPNPTRERTFVEFDVKESDEVSLLVFDARGNVVNKLLENKLIGIGYHQMSFNSNELPIGVYTVFLRIGDEVVSKRLMVMKD